MAVFDGRLVEARDAANRTRVAVEGIGESFREGYVDCITGFVEIWQGEPERANERLLVRLESTLRLGAGAVASLLLLTIAFGELAAGRLEQARGPLEGLVRLLEGRDALVSASALGFLADARRLLGDQASETAALEAQALAEGHGNRLFTGQARLTLGRLAASCGDWETARHALAALDACVEGGHLTWVPGCLDGLGEVAAGLGSDEDAVRLLAAANGARTEIGTVRVPREEEHWAEIDKGLREALGDEGYETARGEGAALSPHDALEWARRARGPRKRPRGGWEALTPTELRVVEPVAHGLTNPQIGERMFVSRATVKTHLAHIFRELDVHSQTELGALATLHMEAASS